ncbi:MAG: hypothetical protein NT009_11540 [Proteobacteria bacterium]|nr:hypothetical protein [Pseudomonadota bacterium]
MKTRSFPSPAENCTPLDGDGKRKKIVKIAATNEAPRGKTAGYLRNVLKSSVIPRIKSGAGSAKLVLEMFNRGAGIQEFPKKLDSRFRGNDRNKVTPWQDHGELQVKLKYFFKIIINFFKVIKIFFSISPAPLSIKSG